MQSVSVNVPSARALLEALTSVSQGILFAGADRRILYANDAFTQITGFSNADVLGQPCEFIQGPETDAETVAAIRAAFAKNEPFSGDILNYKKSGEPFWNELTISPVFDDAGRTTNYIGFIRDITALRSAEAALLASAERQGFLLDRIQAAIVIHSATTEIVYANEAATKWLDKPYDAILGEVAAEGRWDFVREDGSLMPIDEYPVHRVLATRSVLKAQIVGQYHVRDDRTTWLMCNGYPVLDGDGEPTEVIVSFTDVTELKIAERALQKSDERLRLVMEGSRDASWDWDLVAHEMYLSPRWWSMLGHEVDAMPPVEDLWVGMLHADDVTRVNTEFEAMLADGLTSSYEIEFRLRHREGHYVPILSRGFILRDERGHAKRVSGTNMDLTEHKRSEQRINQLAFYDALTSLPNRRLLIETLERALNQAQSGVPGALLFIDIDNFKILNDTMGHHRGDQLLQSVAQRLRLCVGSAGTVARFGGDEFVVILEDLPDSSGEAAIEAEQRARTILKRLAAPYTIAGQEHCTTASIGIALFTGAEHVDNLLMQADLAMYEAKAMGRNTVRSFDRRMQTDADERLSLENDLRRSLNGNELTLYYQPQVNASGAVTGAEVLLRWIHPQRGLVPPSAFIPLAEATGLILPIGNWVLRTACAQLAAWSADPVLKQLSLSINVSVRQFREPDFVENVLDFIAFTGADPHKIVLEITETLLAERIGEIADKMQRLKECGIRWSIDDFGTGYSSLQYLRRLPIDELKIDRTFVKEVLTSQNDRRIARAIITLGEELELDVIAEGVETEGQRALLFENRCRAFQGYLFGRPAPLDDFESKTRLASRTQFPAGPRPILEANQTSLPISERTQPRHGIRAKALRRRTLARRARR